MKIETLLAFFLGLVFSLNLKYLINDIKVLKKSKELQISWFNANKEVVTSDIGIALSNTFILKVRWFKPIAILLLILKVFLMVASLVAVVSLLVLSMTKYGVILKQKI